ncbi:uncharacterized protein LOC126890690 [Diabrotica virgifera virgifera]|uniref:DUF243 domain-containing protein n=1 Tax=Diabrotica virgifera virgifera TaxID=50390 RepID=A0ABM5L029_DIAVI|nr:uncharacterized protein LOC126890690 [Diabrotica virgifera virgifera]
MRLLLLLGFILTVRAASRPLQTYFRSLPNHWFRGFGSTTAAPPTPFVEINGQPSSTPAPYLADNFQSINNRLSSDIRSDFGSTTSSPPTSFIELNQESVSTPSPLENEGLQASSTPFNLNSGLVYGQNLQNYGQNLQSYGQNLQSYGQNLLSYGQNLHGNLFNGFGSTTSAPPTSLVELNSESVSTPAPLESGGLQSGNIPFNLNNGLLSGQNINGNLLFNGFQSTTSAPPTSFVELNGQSVSTPAPFQNEAIQSSSIPFNVNNGLLSGFGSDVSNNLQSYGQNVNSNLLFDGFGSSTTSAPPANNEILSRFGSDISNIQQAGDNNAFYSTEGPVSSTSAPFDMRRLFLQDSSLFQSSPRLVPEISPIKIQGKTTGGSIYDTFGSNDEVIESQSEKPLITKNVYFFTAPEDEAVVKPRIYFEPTRKHVNVVYIKAPAAPSLGPIEITPPKQESPEKTVVYVLVKKPEEQKIIVKPGPTAKPANPDVFFINYKNEEEAQNALEELQSKEEVQQENQADELLNAHFDINPFKRKVSDKKVRKTRNFY